MANQLLMTRLALGIVWLGFGIVTASAQPRSLHPNVTVDTYTAVSRPGARLAQDPVSKLLVYADAEGNVFRILTNANGQLTEQQIASVAQHGIQFLQGMAFVDSTLILSGIRRMPYQGVGRVMKGKLRPDGSRQWTTLLETEPYPYSGTAFDHAFNGICVSPGRDSLYLNSGSRTDHGEVQDNGGRFPNLRETALTARIFKVPLSAENLILPNDDAALRQAGWLFCEGVRNTFDMAFTSEGRLFGAENAGNRSDPEELNWLRPGHHYGFPWVIGGNETPQQFPDYDPHNDPLLSPGYFSNDFRNDPTYPPRPNRPFTPGIVNTGPDGWFVVDPNTRQLVPSNTIQTFTSHASPLGLVFDVDSVLADFTGLGFVLGFSPGRGLDLSSLKLTYDSAADNYRVQVTRVADGFNQPVDAELIGTTLYVLERGRQAISRVQFRERVNPNAVADLSLIMTTNVRTVGVGQTINTTIAVTNAGPSMARSIRITNHLPAGLTFVGGAAFTLAGDVLTATIDQLAKGQKQILTYQAKLTQPGVYRNAAQIAQVNTSDPDSAPGTGTADGEDDAASVDVRTSGVSQPIYESPNPNGRTLPPVQSHQPAPDPDRCDLSLSMQMNPLTPRLNETGTLTLTIRNDGGKPADEVRIHGLLPTNIAIESGQDWTVTPAGFMSTAFSVGVGQSVTRQLRVHIVTVGPFVVKSTLSGPADADSTPNNGFDNGEDDEARTNGRGLP